MRRNEPVRRASRHGVRCGVVGLLLVVVSAAAAAEPTAGQMELGRTVVASAFTTLSSNLTAALQAGGVTNAIPFCSEKALPITAELAREHGVELRRVSHRVRNPANRASEEERALIARFQAIPAEQRSPVVVTNAGAAVFYAPITLANPLCLVCHGKPGPEVSAETQAVIARLYPRDEATGFQPGDVRGLWKVAFPAPRR